MVRTYSLSAGQVAELVNKHEELFDRERNFTTVRVNQCRKDSVIPEFLCQRRLITAGRRQFAEESIDWIVLSIKLRRHTFATQEKVGTIFRAVVDIWGEDTSLRRLTQLYNIDNDYIKLVTRLAQCGIDLPEEITREATLSS